MTLIGANEQYFKVKLDEINKLIEKNLVNVANEEYQKLVAFFSDERFEIEYKIAVEVYVSYAFFLFEVGEYESFLDMIYCAQSYGFEAGEIEDVLYEAFVEPNLFTFESNYNKNIANLKDNYLNSFLNFNEINYWYISTGNNDEFYIYNKNTRLLETKVSFFKKSNEVLESVMKCEFSDNVFWLSGGIGEVFTKMDNIKKNYIILKNSDKFLASLQAKEIKKNILESLIFFDDIKQFTSFIVETNAYLPRNIISNISTTEIESLLNEVHNDRIKSNANRDNILLSICIPSFNRGKIALKSIERLLNLKYDYEIEIVLSNNGTQNETKEYYTKIKEIKDSRVTYFEFEENQGFAKNLCQVCDLAKGKYSLLLSDEDSVNFTILDSILNDLKINNGEISIYRTSTTNQSRVTNGQYSGGVQALKAYMLTSNYVSGIIVNNDLIRKYEATNYINNNIDNITCYSYPHMYWELLLLQYGRVMGTDQVLIDEGIAEQMESIYVSDEGGIEVPIYATLESRLQQHEGFFRIFNNLELFSQDKNLFREMYIRLSMKTLYLVSLSISVFYKKDPNNDIQEILKEAYEYCTDRKFLVGNRHEAKQDIEVIKNQYLMFSKNI